MGKKQDLSKMDNWIRNEYERNTQRIEDNLSKDGSFDPDKINSKILYHRIQMQILEQEELKKKMDIEKQMQRRAKLHQMQKWTCILTMLLITTFTVSMTSEAARAHLKNAFEYITGDESNDEQEKELVACQEIQKELDIPVPTLIFRPGKQTGFKYNIDHDNATAIIEYECEDTIITLHLAHENKIDVNTETTQEKPIKNINIMHGTLSVPIQKITISENKETFFSSQWKYKKGYYKLSGNVTEKEFIKILKYTYF
ncbi:MAG: DUF4367 domain-containing protein [Lachnospiraceae bacterium]|nr:DUF4367 domain-containing protein [Lachnospiraceae bacterium]